jgi:O-methyltransferase
MDIEALLAHANRHVAHVPAEGRRQAQALLTAAFDAAGTDAGAAPDLNVFVFHNPVPEDSRQVVYRDVTMDHGAFDFAAILETFVARAAAASPRTRVLLVTGTDAVLPDIDVPGTVVVRLPLDPRWPMYERVRAMHAYVGSRLFDAPTAFLDSDAFPAGPLLRAFGRPFDIGTTFRRIPGLMPLNEGVLFASARDPAAVRSFFDAYLATYDALAEDPVVVGYYGDVRRWRGGQLSLNAVAAAGDVVDEFDLRTVAGATVAYLPCDTYNYWVTRDDQLTAANGRGRLILHLKGGSKRLVQSLRALGTPGPRPAQAPPAPRAEASGRLTPHFAFFNKSFREPPFDAPGVRQQLEGSFVQLGRLFGANAPDGSAILVDDLFVWFRNLGFLGEPAFVEAFAPYRNDHVLRARIWRVYVLCWAARSCLSLDGDFVDLGCYDGKTVDVMTRYADPVRAGRPRRWVIYDMFENPPAESMKSGHGPALFGQVQALFADRPYVEAVKGALPDSFAQGLPARIAFAQLDLNDADAEMATLEAMFDRLVPGGILVLDDFGFRRYRESHERETAFFAARGMGVLELPTGQGLVIGR